METRVVNLFAGPGAGKSTTAAGVFSLLNLHGVSCELVTEFAKDLTWNEDRTSLNCPPYVFGEQLRRLERLQGKVEFIITDSPILLSIIYGTVGNAFEEMVNDVFNEFTNYNFQIVRMVPFRQAGRLQDKPFSLILDQRIEDMLHRLYHPSMYVPGNERGINEITHYIMKHILSEEVRFEIKPTVVKGE